MTESWLDARDIVVAAGGIGRTVFDALTPTQTVPQVIMGKGWG